MSATEKDPPIDDEINDPGNEDPGSVWPIQQEPRQDPPLEKDEPVHEQDDAQ